jgi:hypothetical protein
MNASHAGHERFLAWRISGVSLFLSCHGGSLSRERFIRLIRSADLKEEEPSHRSDKGHPVERVITTAKDKKCPSYAGNGGLPCRLGEILEGLPPVIPSKGVMILVEEVLAIMIDGALALDNDMLTILRKIIPCRTAIGIIGVHIASCCTDQRVWKTLLPDSKLCLDGLSSTSG